MQPLKRFLKPIDATFGEYGSLIVDLLNPSSTAARDSDLTHVMCLFDTDTLLGEAFFDPAKGPNQGDIFLDALDAFCARHSEKTVVTNTFYASTARPSNFNDVLSEGTVRSLEATLNRRLVEVARMRPNLLIVDIEFLFRHYGERQLISSAFWYVGRIRYTTLMFRVFGDLIRQAIAAYNNKARKLLVLDLDNTLWGGVLGEVGPRGVELSEEGRGACFRDFQRAIKALKQSGTLLAICSKNNLEDVLEVFEQNSMMILSRDDFSCIQVNWQPKPENILDIATTLNISPDSFVFIDDDPVERAIVAKALPEIVTPDFPERLETLREWFIQNVVRPHFGKYRISNEDLQKTEQYKANESRRRFAADFDLDGFLSQLEIRCDIRVNDPSSVLRAAQLTQKTNQFNLTTQRYDIPDITKYIADPNRALIVLDYSDRFGSEGIVALSMLEIAEGRISNFLMSCRVIGRKIEDQLLDRVLELFRENGLSKVFAEFVPTAKNQVVKSFYERHGFTLIAEHEERRTYEREI